MSARLAKLVATAGARPWIIPYLTAGYPEAGETVNLLLALEEGGADAIELGLPWSDPLADGPVIQAASQEALAGGIDHRRILELVAAFRRRSTTPVVLMGYVNPILAYGADRFFAEAATAGADGLIVPDLPIEEAERYLPAAIAAGLDWIHLAAPTSTVERLERIDAGTTAFVYVVALTGVTGVRDALPEDLRQTLGRAERALAHPFVVGFGFSRRQQVGQACPPAAGIVAGSALLRALGEQPDAAGRRRAAREFVRGLRA